jgi:hypothetical protein
VATFSAQFYTFWTESILSERISLKLMLTSNDIDFGKEYYTKVVDNFYIFPASIYMPLSAKWSSSNDLWKLGGAAENSDLNRMT